MVFPLVLFPLFWGCVLLYLRSPKGGCCSISDDFSCFSIYMYWCYVCVLHDFYLSGWDGSWSSLCVEEYVTYQCMNCTTAVDICKTCKTHTISVVYINQIDNHKSVNDRCVLGNFWCHFNCLFVPTRCACWGVWYTALFHFSNFD